MAEAQELVKLGDLIDMTFDLREDKRKLESQIKDIKETLAGMEAQILERLVEQGMTTAKAGKASVTVTRQTVPQTDDFDAALDWIGEDFENRKYLLYRRILSAPFLELTNTGEKVPGISAYEKQGLSVRKIPD